MKFRFSHKVTPHGRDWPAMLVEEESTEAMLDRVRKEVLASEFGPELGIGESIKIERVE